MPPVHYQIPSSYLKRRQRASTGPYYRRWIILLIGVIGIYIFYFFYNETQILFQSMLIQLTEKVFVASKPSHNNINGTNFVIKSSTKPNTMIGNTKETLGEKYARLSEHLFSSYPYVVGDIQYYDEATNREVLGEDNHKKSHTRHSNSRLEYITPHLPATLTNVKNAMVPLTPNTISGVVLLIHTCKVKPHVWWQWNQPPSQSPLNPSPSPLGMPVEKEIVKLLTFNGYIPIAMAPVANRRSSQCWADGDKNIVLQVTGQVYRSLNLTSAVPLYALGIANGAIFVERMAAGGPETRGYWNISAVSLMNGGVWRSIDKAYPPLLFISMARNADLCSHNNRTLTALRQRGVDSAQVAVLPRPMSANYFTLGRVLSGADSERLFRAIRGESLLWPGSDIFIEDPLFGTTRAAIKRIVQQTLPHVVPAVDSFKFPGSPLAQLFSLSWGYKETTEEGTMAMIEWFRKHK